MHRLIGPGGLTQLGGLSPKEVKPVFCMGGGGYVCGLLFSVALKVSVPPNKTATYGGLSRDEVLGLFCGHPARVPDLLTQSPPPESTLVAPSLPCRVRADTG